MNNQLEQVLDVASGNKALVISFEPVDLVKLFLVLFLATLLAHIVAKQL
jgi:hypothetical protein